jgi:DNA recombination protein RmuC
MQVTLGETADGTPMALTIALAALLLIAAGAALWLLIDRGRTAARLASITSERDAVQRERDAARERLAGVDAALRSAATTVEGLRVQIAERAKDVESLESRSRRDLQAAAERHAEELSHVEQVARVQLEAVKREKDAIDRRLAEFEEKMQKAFGSLAADALKKSTGQFLELAEQKLSAKHQESSADMEKRREAVERLVQPIAETLRKTDEKLAAMERARTESGAAMLEQVRQVGQVGVELRTETARLVKALREPQVRGRYGELQLKRVAELAGMRSYCDFSEQESVLDDEGTLKRPDMIVRLPNGREVVVDAKANLKPYLDAMEAATPEEAESHLRRFADGLLKQAGALSKKSYFREYSGSPDFVVMFVPGDQFVDAALCKRPELLELAAEQRVILASPSTLIAMLRAVAVGFAEQKLTEEARSIKDLATELHERAAVMLDHLASLGKGLETTVERFNKLTGSVQARLVPTLKRIEEKGVSSGKELPEPEQVVVRPRLPSAVPGTGLTASEPE